MPQFTVRVSKTLLSGSGVPASTLGAEGDFYIDTAANTRYGPKTTTGWGSSVALAGSGTTGGASDASTTVKGVVQLAGDLGGTAALPTVPGLAGKVGTSDVRLSDTRTPTDLSVTNAKVAAAAAIAESKLALASDAVAATASRRTLGAGATQAAPGDHAHAREYPPFAFRGVLALSTADSNPVLVYEPRTITELGAAVNTPPAGAAVIATYYKTTATGVRTTIGTVSIAIGARIAFTTGLSVAVVRGDVVTCRITQIGSTTAGADLTTAAMAA